MKIKLNRINAACLMEATNEEGLKMTLDGTPAIGGMNGGFRPMQAVLAALAGCSTIDVIDILSKQKQMIDDLQVEVEAERDTTSIPSVFTHIDLHFLIRGNLSEDKIQRALDLSFGKYCSVAKMLEKSVNITYRYTLNA